MAKPFKRVIHPTEQQSLPDEGYHLTTDLTDRTLSFIKDAKAIAPDKPSFLYFCPGACHAPHHAPKDPFVDLAQEARMAFARD